MDFFLFYLLQSVIAFVVLMITGRIYSKISSSIESNWIDDVKASAIISVTVFLAHMLGLVFPQIMYFIPLLQIGLIYVAFQMEGIIDIVFFYVVYRGFNMIIQWSLVGFLGSVPMPPSSGMGFGGG